MLSLNEIMMKEAFVILQNAKSITNELDPVIDLVVENVKQKRWIGLTGIGKNEIIAIKSSATYNSLSIPSFFIDAATALHGDIGCVNKDQLIIAYSKSGNSIEVVNTLEECGRREAKIVCITCSKSNKMSELAEKYNGIHIGLSCDMEADFLDLVPSASSTLFIAVADAIGICAAEKLGLTKEKFHLNHPAGSLGQKLEEELHK
jgi:arabinose-5-phosphate isomerase